jgi:DNA-binding response OmpR family regulator
LSERLKIREVETRVTYSGEDALGYLDNQDTELMVLDLKMPGIDGFEVLRRIKATKPWVEVIILTGQGSDFDRQTCLDLGAFAFLERPVDIDVLTHTMRKAHEKIRARKTNENQENH